MFNNILALQTVYNNLVKYFQQFDNGIDQQQNENVRRKQHETNMQLYLHDIDHQLKAMNQIDSSLSEYLLVAILTFAARGDVKFHFADMIQQIKQSGLDQIQPGYRNSPKTNPKPPPMNAKTNSKKEYPVPIPKDFPVQPLDDDEHPPGRVTCYTCGLSWDDNKPTSMTPAPAGRCPFEHFHRQHEPDCQHEPDWKSIQIQHDGDELYVDINCKLCGASGCVGSRNTLEKDINWE